MDKPTIVVIGLTNRDETQVIEDIKPLRYGVDVRFERIQEQQNRTDADWAIVLKTHVDGGQIASAQDRYGSGKMFLVNTVDAVVRRICNLTAC
jgi:hypothetical protein